jgi:lipopolysaccharide/colanic/teichoic acid biosynthesis glycosyltransferase
VGLIGVFFFAVLGILAAATSRQLADEFKAWTPWLIKRCIRRAVRQLPESLRERFTEEWQSHINEIPGEVGKLFEALGYLRASWNMSRGLTGDMPYALTKRVFDIAFASSAIVVFLPLFAFVAVLMRLISDDPLIVVERRMGHKHETIRLLRFHTMTDGRVTPTGLYMRQSHLDGLPQLINVLQGEMSLIGPRPLRFSEFDLVDKRLPSLSRRTNVKPGIFGWAKMNGFGEEATTLEKLQREIEHDICYLDNRSFLLDLKILVTGIWNILFGRAPRTP